MATNWNIFRRVNKFQFRSLAGPLFMRYFAYHFNNLYGISMIATIYAKFMTTRSQSLFRHKFTWNSEMNKTGKYAYNKIGTIIAMWSFRLYQFIRSDRNLKPNFGKFVRRNNVYRKLEWKAESIHVTKPCISGQCVNLIHKIELEVEINSDVNWIQTKCIIMEWFRYCMCVCVCSSS